MIFSMRYLSAIFFILCTETNIARRTKRPQNEEMGDHCKTIDLKRRKAEADRSDASHIKEYGDHLSAGNSGILFRPCLSYDEFS